MADQDTLDIRLLCLDVDGVMTDGRIVLDDHGVETKSFHVRDGSAIRMWIRLGLEIAIVSGRSSMSLQHRADELGVLHVIQKSPNKRIDVGNLMNMLDIPASQTAMLGDDLPDLPAMDIVGYPMAVADGVVEVREAAEYVTTRPGGHGAVREAIEHILRSMDRWDEAVERYLKS